MTINDMYISNCLCTTTTTTTTATKLLLQHYYTIYYYATTTLLPLPLPLSLLATITATATAIAHSWCERIWVPGLKIVFLALPSEVPSGGNKATSTKNPPAFLRHWVEKFSHFFFLKKYTWREDLRNFWTSVSVLVGSYNFETDDWQKRLKTRCLLYFDFEHQHGKNSMFFFFFLWHFWRWQKWANTPFWQQPAKELDVFVWFQNDKHVATKHMRFWNILR